MIWVICYNKITIKPASVTANSRLHPLYPNQAGRQVDFHPDTLYTYTHNISIHYLTCISSKIIYITIYNDTTTFTWNNFNKIITMVEPGRVHLRLKPRTNSKIDIQHTAISGLPAPLATALRSLIKSGAFALAWRP